MIKASNVSDHGFDELYNALRGKTSIMVGLSGVGKSSLIQQLLPDQDIRIGELYGFRELRPFIGHCKFSDCSHHGEPDCAIQQALKNGDINEERFAHFCKMTEEYVN